jgi:hypothetical protein
MEWNVGTIMSIGLRVIAQRTEVERVGRRVIAHIALTEEIYSEVKALLNKIVPELVGELKVAETKAKVVPLPPPAPPAVPVGFDFIERMMQPPQQHPRHHDPRSRRGR